MQTTARQITAKKITSVPLPSDLYGNLMGAVFIDGISLSPATDYRSAVLIGNPAPASHAPKVGIFACHKDGGYFAQVAPQGASGWPDSTSVSAMCGVTGGMAALATVDNGSMTVRVHNTPVASDGGWERQCEIRFDGIQGTIQAMLERNNKIYGFIKGSEGNPNAFFYSEVRTQAAQWFPCDAGTAAAQAFYPIPSDVPSNLRTLRRIAFFNEPTDNAVAVSARVYAIDETHASVLHVCLDKSGAPIPVERPDAAAAHTTDSATPNVVATVPLAKQASWGILVDDTLRKAYCRYTTDHGYIMPYAVGSDGSLTRGEDTISVGGGDGCPSVDSTLHLLYGISSFDTAKVYDTASDTAVTVNGDPLPSLGAGLTAIPSTWADSDRGILYVSAGKVPSDTNAQSVLVFQISAG